MKHQKFCSTILVVCLLLNAVNVFAQTGRGLGIRVKNEETGKTEGQINRLKMLKRQRYGRAKFDLLKARVLNPV